MPNELDPSDVYPPANLPPGAAQWGRSIQGDVTKLKSAVTVHEQMLANVNRGTASSLANQASQIQRLSERVQTYRRVLDQAELVSSATYPTYGITFSMAPPDWATSGTVLAYTFPSWSGTVSVGGSCEVQVMPIATWDGNAPLVGATAQIYNDGGAGGTRLNISSSHSHPVEVKSVTPGFAASVMQTGVYWAYSTGTSYSGISLTVDITVLWN